MFIIKKIYNLIVIIAVVLAIFFFFNVVKASTITDNVSGIVNFFSTNIIAKVKKDFCTNYVLNVTNGDWKSGEFRTNFGTFVCTSFSVSTSTTTKTIPSNINQSSIPVLPETQRIQTINNPTPDIYTSNVSVGGSSLDANDIITLTNQERKNNNQLLVNLNGNRVLAKIASVRVKDMFAEQYFEHNSPAGDNASKEAVNNNYSYITIGENIALGSFDGSKGVVTAWMNSPGHRANILNVNYTEIGVYAEQGNYKGQNVWIAAQIFGKPMGYCREADVELKNKIANYEYSAENMSKNIKGIDADLKTLSSTDVQTYNAKIAERNNLAGLYNNLVAEIKSLVIEYNKEVSTYNTCIKTQ